VIFSSPNSFYTVVRNLSVLLNATAQDTMSLDYALQRETCLQVQVSGGSDGTGSITFTGTVVTSPGNTGAGSETLTFTNNGFKSTSKRFVSVSSVTTTGFSDESTVPTIKVKSIGPDGSIQHMQTTLKTGWPGFIDRGGTSSGPGQRPYRGEWPSMSEQEQARLYINYDETWYPRIGDIFVDEIDASEWFVRSVPIRFGGYLPRFWEIVVTRRDSSQSE